MTGIKPRILMVLSRSLSSSDGGREALIIDFIRRISAYCEISIAVFNTKSESEKAIISSHKKLGVSSTIVLRKPGFFSVIKNLVMYRGAMQEALFFSRRNLRVIEDVVGREEIVAVYFDMIRLFKYAEEVRNNTVAKVVFDLDDLLSLRYDFFSNSKLTPVQVFGSYGEFIPKIFSNILISKVLPGILRYEAGMCRAREIAVAKIATVVLITSPSEKVLYQGISSRQINVFTNFPIVSPKRISLASGEVGDKELVWLGNNHVAHNIEALEYLISGILPRLDGFSLVIAGKTPSDFIERHKNNELVVFVGFLPCKDALFRPGKVLIAPFRFGTGVKIKLLEAMSSGVAVITNDVGFQGIPANGNVYFTPCGSDEEIISKARMLTSDHVYISNWIREQQETLAAHFSRSYEEDVFLAISNAPS